MNMLYFVLFYYIMGVIFFFLHFYKFELNSLFVFFVFFQIIWLMLRIFHLKTSVSDIKFLTFAFPILFIIFIIKIINKNNKSSKTSFFTTFLSLLYKKPFNAIHIFLKTNLYIYKQILKINAIYLYPQILYNRQIFFIMFAYFPAFILNISLLIEIFYYKSVYYSFWLFPLNFFFQSIGTIILFFAGDYFEDEEKFFFNNYPIAQWIKEKKLRLEQKEDVIQEKYKANFLNVTFNTCMQQYFVCLKNKFFNIYFFTIATCFILNFLRWWQWNYYILGIYSLPPLLLITFLIFSSKSFEETQLDDEINNILHEKNRH